MINDLIASGPLHVFQESYYGLVLVFVLAGANV